MVSSYFDETNYDNPINYYIDDYFVSLQASKSILVDWFVSKNIINLYDSLSGLFEVPNTDFFY